MIKKICSKGDPEMQGQASKIIGRTVLGDNNEEVGKVADISCSGNRIEGIILKTGKVKTFIENTFIRDLYTKSVFLKICPITRLIGMTVFNSKGKRLGKVIDVEQQENTNKAKNIIIKKNIFKKKQSIPTNQIETSKSNIVLREHEAGEHNDK